MAEASYPDDLLYHPEHDWARIEDESRPPSGSPGTPRTRSARSSSSSRPRGHQLTKDEPYAEVESVKAVSDVFAPLSGEIVAVNEALTENPETINEDPYGAGWLVRVRLRDPAESESLLDAEAYAASLADARPSGPDAGSTLTATPPPPTPIARDARRDRRRRSVQELFDRQIPEPVRLRRALDLPAGLSEQEVYAHLRELAARNVSAEEELCFLGAGMYDHYVPALIDMLMERSEFLTPYTPYQPEISQGGLQVMFEYQTAISELTALPVANASVYDGPSAVAAAAYLAKLHNGRPRIVASAGLHPHTLRDPAHLRARLRR